ncbi:hypothetical protein EVAR_77336_1 [Eumeta japonica]|uniref:Uncharacterized protein n=1 Tax=Eumeta variegata TaxID=151549 RepID=A0A4C1UX19_EUMVA|nr:hypothetical protein EVAR_77336_1 [Eumeta japonica]
MRGDTNSAKIMSFLTFKQRKERNVRLNCRRKTENAGRRRTGTAFIREHICGVENKTTVLLDERGSSAWTRGERQRQSSDPELAYLGPPGARGHFQLPGCHPKKGHGSPVVGRRVCPRHRPVAGST